MCGRGLYNLELTFAIIKPHLTAVPFRLQVKWESKDVQNRILSNGFYVIRTKKDRITAQQANMFYEEHKNKFFYNRLVTFMCSGPCYFHILARENAIQLWRSLMGPTKVFNTIFSHPNSIRGEHGLSDTRNATHGSDSTVSFEKEVKVFFPDFNSVEWHSKEKINFLGGNIVFDKKRFIHLNETNS